MPASTTKVKIMSKTLIGAVGCMLALNVHTAWAGATRTFVSGTGVDSGGCDVGTPCRSFTYALSQTNAGGEIIVVASGSFAPFTIANAVSIVAPAGVYADVAAKNKTPGITIAAGATDVVTLRGVTVSGPARGDGIDFDSGGTLTLEGVEVSGFASSGKVGLNVATAGKLFVRDSTFRDNFHGIVVGAPSGVARASLDRVHLTNNASVGLYAFDGSDVTISNCVASGNTYGFDAQTTGSGGASLNIDTCQIASNSADGVVIGGVNAFGGLPIILVSNSTVVDNGGIGLHGAGGPIGFLMFTRGNNTIRDNAGGSLTMTDSVGPS
jgi:hypothetical protein